MSKDTNQDDKIKEEPKEEKPFFFRWRFIILTILVLLRAFSNYKEGKYTNPRSQQNSNINKSITIIEKFLNDDSSKNK